VLALGGDAVVPFAADVAAAGRHVEPVLADGLPIGRQHRDAIHGRAEQIAVAIVVRHAVGTGGPLGDRLLLGELAGVDVLLQRDRHVDDAVHLLGLGVQHFLPQQIARQHTGGRKPEQGDAEQNAELGRDGQVVELHGRPL
jgi:hypothetical protein